MGEVTPVLGAILLVIHSNSLAGHKQIYMGAIRACEKVCLVCHDYVTKSEDWHYRIAKSNIGRQRSTCVVLHNFQQLFWRLAGVQVC